MRHLISATSAIICTLGITAQSMAGILYVDANATGPAHDGTTWCSAFLYLQDALAIAQSGDEIRVADGTYRPDQGAGQTPGDRTATFQLLNGVALKGGYAGCGADDPDAHDFKVNETALSGDLKGDDTPVICTQDSPDCDVLGGLCDDGTCIILGNTAENAYSVVNGSGTNPTAVMEAFTITSGNADKYPSNGAGMYNAAGSPTVNNCTFRGNAADDGGGMYNYNGSSPTITYCTFYRNAAHLDGAGISNNYASNPMISHSGFSRNAARLSGGAIYNWAESNPSLTTCTFNDNSAGQQGGGIYTSSLSIPLVRECAFTRNHSMDYGGAIYGSGVVENCIFSANRAERGGGGMANSSVDMSSIHLCTFRENSAGWYGGGIYGGGTVSDCTFERNTSSESGGGMYTLSESTVYNSIFTNNAAGAAGGGMVNGYASTSNIRNCRFIGNSATGSGGGMFNDLDSNPVVVNCLFIGNSADGGGGMANFQNRLILTNCTFSGNRADYHGGGLVTSGPSTVANCVFISNAANSGGGMYTGGGTQIVDNCSFSANVGKWDFEPGGAIAGGSPTITNCIMWGNTPTQVDGLDPVVNYSIVQGGWNGLGGVGVINDDPHFVDPAGADGDLGTEDDNLRVQAGSPAIDAGNNLAVPADLGDVDQDGDVGEKLPLDHDSYSRFFDAFEVADTGNGKPPIVDMGAFEFQPDCNGNGVPDYVDVANGFSPDCNDNDRPDECEIPEDSSAPGGPFYCLLNCDLDCNKNGLPDDCEAPQAGKVTSNWIANAGVWNDGEGNVDWCLPEAPDNNSNASFNVTIAAPGAAVTLNTSPTIDELSLLDGATVVVNDESGANTRTLVVDGEITNTGVFLATDRERLILDAPIIEQAGECEAGGVIKATDGESGPGEAIEKSIVEINGAIVHGGSLVTEGDHSEIHLIGGAELVDTCIRGVVVPDGQNGRFAGVVTNDDLLSVRGLSTNTRLEPVGPVAKLDGGGRVRLTHKSFARLGDFKQKFTNGPQHAIEGAGIIFGGMTNDGAVEAHVPGEPLVMLPPGRKENNGELRAVSGGILRISDDVTGSGKLRADGGTIQVRSTEEDGVVVRAKFMDIQGGGKEPGRVEMGFNSQIVLTEGAIFRASGTYGALPDDMAPNASSLSARSIIVLPSEPEGCGALPAEVRLTDSMVITTFGDFVVDGTQAHCDCLSGRSSQTPSLASQASSAALRGGRTPPTIKLLDSSVLDVVGNMIFSGSVAFANASSSNVMLYGNWDNQSICPAGFDWLQGGLSLSGTAPQSFEVAGEDVGPIGAGFGDGTHTNFAVGTLEIQSGANANLVDAFDNNPAVPEDCTEALYVRNLVLNSGAQLTLDGCRLYFLSKHDEGATVTTQGCGALVQLDAGDRDADGDVDLSDLAAIQRCYSDGSSPFNSTDCAWADFNEDARVDLSDYFVFWSFLERLGPSSSGE